MYKQLSIDELSKLQKESLSDIENSNYLNIVEKTNLIEDVFQGKIIHFVDVRGKEFQPLSSFLMGDSSSGMCPTEVLMQQRLFLERLDSKKGTFISDPKELIMEEVRGKDAYKMLRNLK